jgi:hypothetical protein
LTQVLTEPAKPSQDNGEPQAQQQSSAQVTKEETASHGPENELLLNSHINHDDQLSNNKDDKGNGETHKEVKDEEEEENDDDEEEDANNQLFYEVVK